MKHHRYKYDNTSIKQVEKLASKGYTDTKISEIIGIPYSFIQKVTTDYWNNKMKQKEKKKKKSN